jgi:hypothetical protein
MRTLQQSFTHEAINQGAWRRRVFVTCDFSGDAFSPLDRARKPAGLGDELGHALSVI